MRAAFYTGFFANLCFAISANAHFVWVAVESTENGPHVARVYFSEAAKPGEAELIDRVAHTEVWTRSIDGTVTPLKVKKAVLDDGGCLSAPVDFDLPRNVEAECLYGVFSRGNKSMLLHYYAKYLSADAGNIKSLGRAKRLRLDIVPITSSKGTTLTVLWKGKPAGRSEVVILGPSGRETKAKTGDDGKVGFVGTEAGLYSIRARVIESKKGEHAGEKYSEVRHYATLALDLAVAKRSKPSRSMDSALPVMPQAVTSFGAAVADDALYVYGGHTGRAHSYYKEAQANTLWRLDLKNPKAWQALEKGPGLQGLAMVAHGGKLYRIGGFTAKNKEGEDHDLWSLADVTCYDPATTKWQVMSPLPEPRSSFDAAVLGNEVYVIGGWQLLGGGEKRWHKSAYVLDLADGARKWEALPEPPFQRRALSVAAHDGKVFAIGGMQQRGGPTTRVDVFDPTSGKWTQGPNLAGKGMEGFGTSAFALGKRLYVSTMSGKLQRLSEDGKSWETIRQLERARFFHRMLPLAESKLLFVGGADMAIGKFKQVDVVEVP